MARPTDEMKDVIAVPQVHQAAASSWCIPDVAPKRFAHVLEDEPLITSDLAPGLGAGEPV